VTRGIPILVFSVVVWLLGHLARLPKGSRALLVTVAIVMLAAAALAIILLGPTTNGIRLR
jgi:hypothetical protein